MAQAKIRRDRFSMRRSAHGGFYVYDWEAPAGEHRTVGLFRDSGDAWTWIGDQLNGRVSEVIFSRLPR